MTAAKKLISEIETLPKEYLTEVSDFVAFLKMKRSRQDAASAVYADLDEGYKAMAADTEREKEADEWLNGYLGEFADCGKTYTKICLKYLDNAYKNTVIYEQGVQ